MKKLTRNQWIAVSVSLVVIAIFFTTGSTILSFFGSKPAADNSSNELGQASGTEVGQTEASQSGANQSDLQTAQALSAINSQTQTMDATSNSFDSSVSSNKLEIQDIVVGTGAVAVPGKVITVNYSGAFTDGKVFDSSYTRGQPFEFTLGAGQVIQGWDKGFDGMKVGGKRRLVIPASFGYGAAGAGGVIPPNATLVFEVELLGVK